MRKLLVVFPLLLVLVGGCDSTRRDFTYCDTTYTDCKYGYTCNFTTGLCVPETDAGIADTNAVDGPPPVDTSPIDASEGDAKDAPIVTDGTPFDTSGLDTSIIDAPIVDVASPDTRIPDAAGTCSIDNDCVLATGAYCVNTRCVACKTSNQCNNATGKPFCSAQNTCVSCAGVSGPDGGSACPANAPVCASSGSCVECVGNSDCPTAGKAFCVQNKCVGCDVPGATAGGPSAGAADAGAPDGGSTSVGPCTGATPVCVPSTSTLAVAGQCVGCASNSDCSGPAPICNTTATTTVPAYTCAACTSDTQCADKGVGPGVCMFHDNGRCATDAETIYVQNAAGCSGGAGTSASPYCDSQAGIDAVTSTKRLIVMKGSNLYPVTSTSTSSTGQITVIGQNGATTAAGAFVGIHVTVGDLYLRGVTIAGGSNTGIVVESGATLHMDRCIIKGNTRGGLIVQSGANFDISNSVFDGNSGGVAMVTTQFSAAYFGGVGTSSGPHKFWFSTVVNNVGSTASTSPAVVCYDTTQILTGMLMHGNSQDFFNCLIDGTSAWESGNPIPNGATSFTLDPALDSTYHLTSSSPKYPQPCRNFIVPTVAHPFDDMDGQLRPNETRLDCGADEYYLPGQ